MAVVSGLLHLYPDVRTIIRIDGQSTMVIELEDGLRKRLEVKSNLLCAAGTGRFLEQQVRRIGLSVEDLASLAQKCGALHHRK